MYGAWLATPAILVRHFYCVIFIPEVYPMDWIWLTGRVSEDALRHEHPREYERWLTEHGGAAELPAPSVEETVSPSPGADSDGTSGPPFGPGND